MRTILKNLPILFIVFFLSCKNEDPEPSTLTLLTSNDSKSWRVSEYYENGELNNTDCSRDDIWTFKLYDEGRNGQSSFTIEDNFISCGSKYSISGIWRINNLGNRITLTTPILGNVQAGFNQNEVYEIIELSDSKMIFRLFEEDDYGISIKKAEYRFIAYN